MAKRIKLPPIKETLFTYATDSFYGKDAKGKTHYLGSIGGKIRVLKRKERHKAMKRAGTWGKR